MWMICVRNTTILVIIYYANKNVLGKLQISWYKGNTNILPDEDHNDRVNFVNTENGSTIIIRGATETDGGEYVCKVSSVELTHTVEIIGKPLF